MADMKVDGMDQLLAELETLGKAGSRIENSALKEAGDIVKNSIVNEAPVRSGKLKGGITVSRVKTKGGVKQVEVGPDKDGWYGKFVEFGTAKMKANPFMARGYENSKEEAMSTIEKSIKDGLGL
ncbi:HK97 family phage protein [Sporosarcina newyorkensis 2681]|uniref:HK97 family phage protein n=2 Tax=Sporosarcina newyorkensis TaxID=759851 RepID=F9DR25_9BACL|nr:HK97 family phage protein [Sporosarcina newyorkensis 2681]